VAEAEKPVVGLGMGHDHGDQPVPAQRQEAAREPAAEIPDSPITRTVSEQRLDVIAALRELPFRQRQATVLYYWGDLSTATIAEFMELSEGAVRAHLTHARKRLGEVLEASDV